VLDNDITVQQLQINLDDLINGIGSFSGLITESMPREASWLMLDSGRRLERALALIALLRATLVSRHNDALLNQVLESVLMSTDSLTIYLRRYRSAIQLPLVLELLLMDEKHPRSIAYQLQQLSVHISALPRVHNTGRLSEEERLILKVYTDLRLCNVVDLLQVTEGCGIYNALEEFLSETVDGLWKIAEVIAQAYFSHSKTSQLMHTQSSREDEL
jgi:uncharacterized alpha-E superfamily protein